MPRGTWCNQNHFENRPACLPERYSEITRLTYTFGEVIPTVPYSQCMHCNRLLWDHCPPSTQSLPVKPYTPSLLLTFICWPQVPAQAVAANQQPKALAPAGPQDLAAVQHIPGGAQHVLSSSLQEGPSIAQHSAMVKPRSRQLPAGSLRTAAWLLYHLVAQGSELPAAPAHISDVTSLCAQFQ